jgi:signal transduction histidine kinase
MVMTRSVVLFSFRYIDDASSVVRLVKFSPSLVVYCTTTSSYKLLRWPLINGYATYVISVVDELLLVPRATIQLAGLYLRSPISVGERFCSSWSQIVTYLIVSAVQVVVVIIPRDSLWGTSQRRSYEVLAVLLALSLSAGALGIFFIILLTRGITAELRLKNSLIRQQEATKEAENRSSHKSIMFASMSHDLRTPLAAILGLIDLCLCDVMESSELESNLSQMKTCATSLLGSFPHSSLRYLEVVQFSQTMVNCVHS